MIKNKIRGTSSYADFSPFVPLPPCALSSRISSVSFLALESESKGVWTTALGINSTVFGDMAPLNLLPQSEHRIAEYLGSMFPPKDWYPFTQIEGVTSRKTAVSVRGNVSAFTLTAPEKP
jgi:hypothetical protein